MLKKEANKITGGLSAPGKMPEGSYNLPASACAKRARSWPRLKARHAEGCYADDKRPLQIPEREGCA